MDMRRISLLAGAFILSGIATARTVCVPTQPVSPFADTEASTNVSIRRMGVGIRDFRLHPGDSAHADDAARPRTETRYVVTNGVATFIGRTWTRYTRLVRSGYAAIRRETWRAATGGSQLAATGNAYSYEIAYADTGDGTPLLMRNAVAESLDEDGVLTVNAYSLTNGIFLHNPPPCDGRVAVLGDRIPRVHRRFADERLVGDARAVERV